MSAGVSPDEKRKEVLEAAMLDVEEKELGTLQAYITKQMSTSIERLIRRHKWPYHIALLALVMMEEMMCEVVYDKGLEFKGDK